MMVNKSRERTQNSQNKCRSPCLSGQPQIKPSPVGTPAPCQRPEEPHHHQLLQPRRPTELAHAAPPTRGMYPSLTAALGRGDPSPLNGLARVVSTTNWTPLNSGKPSATISKRLPSCTFGPRGPDHAQRHWWQLMHRQVRETGGRGKRKRRNSRRCEWQGSKEWPTLNKMHAGRLIQCGQDVIFTMTFHP